MALTKAQMNRIESYDRDNRRSASIILADIRKYGGEGSGAVQWAVLIRSKDPLWRAKSKTAESACSQPFLFGLE